MKLSQLKQQKIVYGYIHSHFIIFVLDDIREHRYKQLGVKYDYLDWKTRKQRSRNISVHSVKNNKYCLY